MAGGVLLAVGLAAVLGPLANAAISRLSTALEFSADRFSADYGHHAARGWHPTSYQRIRALLPATAAPCVGAAGATTTLYDMAADNCASPGAGPATETAGCRGA